MNSNQKEILNGLKSIGEEIFSFYSDGLKIIEQDGIKTKSYLIAHIAREIDGGLRDILAPLEAKSILQQNPSLKDRGNVASILVALDLPIDDPFAKEYIDVATKFYKFAHRRGATREPRSYDEVVKLWYRYEIILLKLIGSFINQLKQLERIIKFDKPNKQILLALKNILKDDQKERHFYINLKNEKWLEPLYNAGFFSPETITNTTYWNQSEYLKSLSSDIKSQKINENYSKLLIKIINDVNKFSTKKVKVENDRVWYSFLIILSNLPKKKVTDSIIDYIPLYFKSKHENILQSEAIFKLIYSFFENKEIALNHSSKIEKLVKIVFEISHKEVYRDSSTNETAKYYPVVRAYKLKQACENELFYSSIAKFCSIQIVFFVADKLLLYLKSEPISEFWIKNTFYLDDVDKHSHSIETINSTFLKNTTLAIGDLSSEKINIIISTFLSNKYDHKHFTKLSFYLWSKSWMNTKDLFFKFLGVEDKNMIFSTSFWSDDLYFLLDEIATLLTESESSILNNIIERGSQNEHFYNPIHYKNDFKLRWFSALKNNAFFQPKYEEVSKKLNKTKDDIKPEKIRYITHGSISPMTKVELKSTPPEKLIEILKSFDPKRDFRGPSVEGLASNLNAVIKEAPALFFNNTHLFIKVPYRYISEICFSLYDVWSKGTDLNWKNIIDFISIYVNQVEFGTPLLQLKNTTYKYDHNDSIRSFCRLLSKGMRADEDAFDPALLPKVEKILYLFLNKYLSTELSEKDKGKLGSAMHAINSTTGIIIGTFFDFSLRKARLKKINIKSKAPRWSIAERKLYEKLIKNNIQEFYMYLGWHRNQFYFLDYKWTNDQLKGVSTKDIQSIKSYFGGHLIEFPTSRFEYDTFVEIYKKAIIEDWKIVDSSMSVNPLELHATIFYIFDYEDLRVGELITLIFLQNDIVKIRNIIHSLSFKYEKYKESLDVKGKNLFQMKIFKIWNYTLEVLRLNTDIESKDMPTLFYLIKYVTELNEESYQLIKSTCDFVRQGRDLDELIKNLNRLKLTGDINQSSIYACEIFIKSILKEPYYASIMEKEIIEFTEFMFIQKSPQLDEYANRICNEFAKSGQYFLRPIYEKYNTYLY